MHQRRQRAHAKNNDQIHHGGFGTLQCIRSRSRTMGAVSHPENAPVALLVPSLLVVFNQRLFVQRLLGLASSVISRGRVRRQLACWRS
jgi:hypothetical protein